MRRVSRSVWLCPAAFAVITWITLVEEESPAAADASPRIENLSVASFSIPRRFITSMNRFILIFLLATAPAGIRGERLDFAMRPIVNWSIRVKLPKRQADLQSAAGYQPALQKTRKGGADLGGATRPTAELIRFRRKIAEPTEAVSRNSPASLSCRRNCCRTKHSVRRRAAC
jgi:hypothetical protein